MTFRLCALLATGLREALVWTRPFNLNRVNRTLSYTLSLFFLNHLFLSSSRVRSEFQANAVSTTREKCLVRKTISYSSSDHYRAGANLFFLLHLLHSVSADQQTELYSFSNRILQLLYLATARNQLFNSSQQLLLLPSLLFIYIYQIFRNIVGVSIYVTLHHLVLPFIWYYIIWWNVLNSSIESSSRNLAWLGALEDSINLNIYMCSP